MRSAFLYDRSGRCGKWMLAAVMALPMLLAVQLGWSRVAAATETAPAAAETAPAAVQPPFDDLEEKATPEEMYAANAFAIVTVTGGGGHWRPVRGIYRLSIEYDAFFHAVGREDLAERFSRRQTTGAILKALGWVSMVGALALGGWSLFEGEIIPGIGAGALTVAWLGLHHAGTEMRKPEPSAEQALDMAGQYNEALRVKLQLSPAPEDHRNVTAMRRLVRPVVAPVVVSSGAGLVVVGAF
jgi:hypothetical protein